MSTPTLRNSHVDESLVEIPTSELARFRSMFEHQFHHTFTFLASLGPDDWTRVPIDNDVMFLGTRVSRINIMNLLGHLLMTEADWFTKLPATADLTDLAFQQDFSLTADLADGQDLIARFRASHDATIASLDALTPGQLNNRIRFAGRWLTVMGFLWFVFAHHSFHLGQIELLVRQNGHMAPEFLEWSETKRVVG
jgi:uncharacterized damage-inducible protein DinB